MQKDQSNRKNITTGAPWEDIIGYCRAVRVGNVIEVSGTAPVKDGKPFYGPADEQMRCCLEIISKALEAAGASLNDVVRTRMYVTDISQWEAIGRVHGEFFKDIKPATTMVEVSALIDPQLLVEVEATAIIAG